MGVFHVFKIVQMLPNRAKHHIFPYFYGETIWSDILLTHFSPVLYSYNPRELSDVFKGYRNVTLG